MSDEHVDGPGEMGDTALERELYAERNQARDMRAQHQVELDKLRAELLGLHAKLRNAGIQLLNARRQRDQARKRLFELELKLAPSDVAERGAPFDEDLGGRRG